MKTEDKEFQTLIDTLLEMKLSERDIRIVDEGALIIDEQITITKEEDNKDSLAISFIMNADPIFVAHFVEALMFSGVKYEIYESYIYNDQGEMLFESDLITDYENVSELFH